MRQSLASKHSSSSFASLSTRLALCCALACGATCLDGCAGWSPYSKTNIPVAAYEPDAPNPLFVQTDDVEFIWDAVVDVIDNYYPIDSENPPRSYPRQDAEGKTYLYQTEGRLETEPTIVGGIFEPQRQTAATCRDRWRAYFQTVRSQATVRVAPAETGFFIYLEIREELEDVAQPMGSTRIYDEQYSEDLTKLTQPSARSYKTTGWIPQGRNEGLESRILKEIAWRVGTPRTVIHSGTDPDLKP